MTTYTGRERKAALILLNDTPLGDVVVWEDENEGLWFIPDAMRTPSTGQAELLELLYSVGSHGTFSAYSLAAYLDDACKSAVLRSLAALFGTDRCPVHLADGPLCCTQAQGHEGGHVYEGSSCPQRGDTEAVQS